MCTCRSPRTSSRRISGSGSPAVGPLDLAPVLAHRRRDERQPERAVDRLLRLRGDHLARLRVAEAVLVEQPAPLERALAQLDVVGLRAGEVLAGGAERARVDDAQVHLEAGRGQHGRLRVPAAERPRAPPASSRRPRARPPARARRRRCRRRPPSRAAAAGCRSTARARRRAAPRAPRPAPARSASPRRSAGGSPCARARCARPRGGSSAPPSRRAPSPRGASAPRAPRAGRRRCATPSSAAQPRAASSARGRGCG